MHWDEPVDTLYFPAMHGAHVPPSGPDEPALQVQLVKAPLPAGELEFDGQALQVELNKSGNSCSHSAKSGSLISIAILLHKGLLRPHQNWLPMTENQAAP
jgi:hypothetical protein